MNSKIKITDMKLEDSKVISLAFAEQGWNKSKEQYIKYYNEMLDGKRDILIAKYDGKFAGYLTIVWESSYQSFLKQRIPEIVDLNVLIKYQRNGIASGLMNEAESRISERSIFAGLGVGLMSDYGNAQIMYVKRGYIPDGLGISQNGIFLKYGDKVEVNDDLNLYFIKKVK